MSFTPSVTYLQFISNGTIVFNNITEINSNISGIKQVNISQYEQFLIPELVKFYKIFY